MKIFYLLPVCAVLFSCSKKEPAKQIENTAINTELKHGLPENYSSIDGLFYYSFTKTYPYTSPSYMQSFYASFNDPVKNLMAGFNPYFDYQMNTKYTGNVAVGQVLFGNTNLFRTSTGTALYYYTYNYSGIMPPEISWQTDGNRTFKNIQLVADSACPLISNPTPSITTIDKSTGISINLAPFASNYDSLIVLILETGNSWGNSAKKVISNGAPVVFTPNDFEYFNSGTNNSMIYYCAYKYYHMVVNNKVLVFSNGYKINHSVTLVP